MEDQTVKGEQLFSYSIASGDMRFIEISERTLFLRYDPELGQVIRGETPGCGPECDANFSQILLEYVMGCGDCREADMRSQAADLFGQRVSSELIEHCCTDMINGSDIETLAGVVAIVLNSMDASYEVEQSADEITFKLASCPLHDAAAKFGLTLWLELAHRSLVAMLDAMMAEITPGWELRIPSERESNAPIKVIHFALI